MGIKPGSRSPASMVNKYIGTAYDNVKTVADNIDDVTLVADNLDRIDFIEDNAENIQTVVDNMDDINEVVENIDDINNVSGNMNDVSNVSSNMDSIQNVDENMEDLDYIAENLGVILSTAGKGFTTQQLIEGSVEEHVVGTAVQTNGFLTAGDGGGALWLLTSETGTPSQTPAELGDTKFTDAGGRVWSLVFNYRVKLEALGFTSLTPELRTSLVQGVIDSLSTLSFGGEVFSPSGEFEFSTSTLNETWPNGSGTFTPATNACLVLRSKVSLTGVGVESCTWFVNDPTKTIMYVDNGSWSTIQNIEFKNTYTGVEGGAGHGIFNLVKNLDDLVTGLEIKSVRVTNVASYGIGLNYGLQRNCTLHDIELDFIGADGIDIKSRSTDLEVNHTNSISKIRVKNFGLRLDGQVGLDVRGQYSINDCWFTSFGDGVKSFFGLRLRPESGSNNISKGTTASNIHVLSNSDIGTSGVQVSGEENSISLFTVSGCDIGINCQEGDSCNVSDGVVSGHRTNAVLITTSANNYTMSNVRAVDSGGAANHFRIEGTGFTESNMSGDDTASDWSISSLALASISRSGGNGNSEDVIDVFQATPGRVVLGAKGPSTDIDIALTPKGGGRLRMGEHSSTSTEIVTGYITIRDSSGVARKLAVVS